MYSFIVCRAISPFSGTEKFNFMNHQAAPLKATKCPCFIITLVLFYFDHMAEEILKENKGHPLRISL